MIISFPLSGGHITYSQILVGEKSIKIFFHLNLKLSPNKHEKNFKIEQRICLKYYFLKSYSNSFNYFNETDSKHLLVDLCMYDFFR